MENKKVTVYLVDDHVILREGLKLILNSLPYLEIIGEESDGAKAYQEIDQIKPNLLILDISIPSLSGIEIARKIRRYHPSIKIIILSRHDNEEYIQQMIKYGIHGYVLKDDAGNDLLRAVDAVLKNETYLSPRITNHLVKEISQKFAKLSKKKKNKNTGVEPETIEVPNAFSILSNREREILKLIAEGKSNTEVAESLWISPSTAKVHRANIMKKLKIHKVTDLVKYAIKSGIVEN
jgi:DNA-binding NarL/FixJ family response regulator